MSALTTGDRGALVAAAKSGDQYHVWRDDFWRRVVECITPTIEAIIARHVADVRALDAEAGAEAQVARVRALMVTHQAKDGRVPVCQLKTALDGAR